jgi:hypothetical protein
MDRDIVEVLNEALELDRKDPHYRTLGEHGWIAT